MRDAGGATHEEERFEDAVDGWGVVFSVDEITVVGWVGGSGGAEDGWLVFFA